MFKEFNLDGNVALVTGGGRGIGREIALVLAEAGADVAVTARTTSQIQETASAIERLGRRSLAIKCDVTNYNQVTRMVKQVTTLMGKIDILVNNAGAGIGGGAVATVPIAKDGVGLYTARKTISPEDWNLSIETNLTHIFYFCQAIGPQMLTRKKGKIINILSNNGGIAYPFTAGYSAAKAAGAMLTKVISLEWAPYNINVNAIAPGFFPTEMTRRRYGSSEGREAMLSVIPLKKFAPLRDLGLLSMYLASQASDWMTGQVIYLDGGESAFCS